jgi:NAD(P)-dependent dehydrogenase (short-subunit alcohol dehydrogenase family)
MAGPAELFDLSGQVAVVTGSGKGIGAGIATTLAAAGATVVVSARTAADLDLVVAEIVATGGCASAQVADVTIDSDLEALAAAAVRAYGRLDIWVNNAGGSPGRARLVELDRERWDRALALNLTSVWAGTRAAVAHMDRGSIVNVSSRTAWGAVVNNGHYAAAKAGVNSLTQTLSRELAPAIRVNGVAPGAVPTEIFYEVLGLTPDDLPQYARETGVPLERLGTPLDIAAAVLYLASPASAWMTGETLNVSGGRVVGTG